MKHTYLLTATVKNAVNISRSKYTCLSIFLICGMLLSGNITRAQSSIGASMGLQMDFGDLFYGDSRTSMAIGDINGDGRPDIVTGGYYGVIYRYLNNSTPESITQSTFQTDLYSGIVGTLTSNVNTIVLKDLDGDGFPEVIASTAEGVYLYKNYSGSFSGPPITITAVNPNATADDIDGDGKAELIVATNSGVSIYRNVGTGSLSESSFATAVSFGSAAYSFVTTGDLDGDGKKDIVCGYADGTATVFRNTSTTGIINSSSLASPVSFAGFEGPAFWFYTIPNIVIADLDGDGKQDIAGISGTKVSIMRNTSTPGSINSGSFASLVQVECSITVAYLSVGDLDGDGKPDLANIDLNGNSKIVVLKNMTTSGTIDAASFALDSVKAGYPYSTSIAIADIDMDGVNEIVTANYPVSVAAISVITQRPLPPSVSSLSATTGYPGSTLTINGANFGTGLIVAFGATQAAVSSASSTSLTVTVPTGATYQQVSVTNSLGLTGSSSKMFLPAFDNSANLPGIINFDGKVDFSTLSAQSDKIAIYDIDGDGKADLIVIDSADSKVSVYRNISSSGTITTGSFAAPEHWATYSQPNRLFIKDINGDGKPDLAIGCYPSYTSIFYNYSSAGSLGLSRVDFRPALDYVYGFSVDPEIYLGQVADVDGDGRQDLVYHGRTLSTVYKEYLMVCHNADNTFDRPHYVANVSAPIGNIELADIDGDNKPEMLVTVGDDSIYVFKNISTRGLISGEYYGFGDGFYFGFPYAAPIKLKGTPLGGKINDLDVADIDGDGKPDVIASTDAGLGVLRNITTGGAIGFDHVVTFPGIMAAKLALGDMNGDGKPDGIYTNGTDSNIYVLRNTSTSGSIAAESFVLPLPFASAYYGAEPVIGDIDGDTKPDIAVGYSAYPGATGLVTVLRNNILPGFDIMGANYVCIGSTTTFSHDTSGGTWSSNNVSVAAIGASSGVITGSGLGTAIITYTFPSGAIRTKVISVNSGPSVIIGAANICNGSASILYNTPVGGTWSSSSTAIATVNPVNGTVTGTGVGTAIITYGVGCGINATRIVTISTTTPNAGTITGVSSIAIGTPATLADAATGGVWSASNNKVTVLPSGEIIANMTGTVVVSYTVANICNIAVATKTVTVTSSCQTLGQIGGALISSGYANTPAITIDNSGVPYVTYAGGSGSVLGVQKYIGGSWVSVGSPSVSAGPSAGHDIVIDASGAPYVAYIDHANGGRATVTKFNGTSWNPVGTVGFSAGGIVHSTSIALDGSGVPYVGYTDEGVSNKAIVKKFTGGSWVTVGGGPVSASAADFTDIAVDGSDNAYICFSDYAHQQKASVMKYNGSAWVSVGAAGFSDSTAASTRMIMGAGGVIYVVYADAKQNNKITVKKYDGSAWTTLGPAGFSAGTVQSISMTLDGSGVLYIGYVDNLLGPVLNKFTGSSWVVAGGTSFSSPYPLNIAADVSGNVYLITAVNGGAVWKFSNNVPNITGTAVICPATTASLTNAATGGTWTSSNTSVAAVGSATGVVTAISGGTSTISYTVGSCSATKVVTVSGPVVDTITGTLTVCPSATTILADATSGGVWSSGNTSIATIGSGTGIVAGVAAGTAVITYSITASCGTATATKTVTVNSLPDAGTITGTATVCTGSTTSLTDAITGGTWNSGTTSVATVGTAGVVSGVATGTAVISYSVTNGCGTAAATRVVTVNTVPSVGGITGTATVCTSATTALSNATTGGAWNSSTPSIATVGSIGVVAGVAAGTATISYTVTNSCGTTTVTQVVTVNSLPDAGTITGTATVCVGAATTLVNAIGGGAWSSSNPSMATVGTGTGVVTGIAAGTTTITYSVTGSCGTANAMKVVTVNALPGAGTITGTTTICTGSSTTLSNAIIGGTWSVSPTAIATVNVTGTITGIANGTAAVSYTVTNSCGTATATTVVTVSSTPSAGTITGGTSVNTGATLALGASVSGGTWSVSNAHATISAGGVVTGVSMGSVTVSYTVTNSCGTAVATKNINVQFTLATGIGGSLHVCVGSTTLLTNATTGGTWSSSASVAIMTISPSTGLVTGVAAGTGMVTYTFSGSSVTAMVTVNAMPPAITGASSVCLNATTVLANTLTGGTWSSANTAIASVSAASGMVTGITIGTTSITYMMGTGCYSSFSMTVRPVPVAITGPAIVCTGATATYTDATTGGMSWASSNTAIATIGASSGVLTAVSAGTANITYTLTSGCTATKTISVNPVPAIIAGPTYVCAGSTTTMADATTGGEWSSSLPGVATIGSATGLVSGISIGTTVISYTLNGCRRTAYMTVNALPVAITGSAGLCIGSVTTLSTVSVGGTWTSSASGVASVGGTGIVSGVSAGTATISYTLANTCARSVVVTVSSAPVITGPTSICPGSTATLSASSAGGTWSSSSVSVASIGAATGILSGITTGTSNVSYTISASCKSGVTITVSPASAAITGAASVCTGSTITLTDATTGGIWSSSNTAIASVGSGTGVVTGIGPGTITITYATGAGCYQVKSITVGSALGVISGATRLCIGATTTYISTSPSVGLSWTSSNPSVATVGSISGVVTGIATGTAVITFTPYGFSPYAGCVAIKTVSVNAVPSVAAITGPSSVPVGHTITLANATPGGTWSSGNSALATVNSAGIVSGIAGPAAIISYSVTNGACVFPVTRMITVTVSKDALVGNGGHLISVYPNPTSGAFMVQSSLAGLFTIYTLEGKELQHVDVIEGTNVLHLPAGLAAGVYMCQFNGEDGNMVMVRLVYE